MDHQRGPGRRPGAGRGAVHHQPAAGAAVGLAILATPAAAANDGHGGSLVDGYRLSFLIATGLAVLAAIIVALQLSSKSHRVEPGHHQAAPCGPPPAPPAAAQLGKS
nr:hypothetical protein OG999_31315 [Streptomyces sp. NBC_00886]